MDRDMKVLAETSAMAEEARALRDRGDESGAVNLYRKAAKETEDHLEEISRERRRTTAIFMNNAVALWWKARRYEHCSNLALQLLGSDPPKSIYGALKKFAVRAMQAEELEEIPGPPVQSATPFRIGFVIEDLPPGLAPASEVMRRVTTAQKLFWRDAEYAAVRERPPATHPRAPIKRNLRVISGGVRIKSYELELWLHTRAEQIPLRFGGEEKMVTLPNSTETVENALSYGQAICSHNERAFRERVPNINYRQHFLKIFKNLSPGTNGVREVEFGGGDPDEGEAFRLTKDTRSFTKKVLEEYEQGEREIDVTGTLREIRSRNRYILLTVEDENGDSRDFQLKREHEMAEEVNNLWEQRVKLTADPNAGWRGGNRVVSIGAAESEESTE